MSGMCVLAKSWRAAGITNRIASIRITRPNVHCNAARAVLIRCSDIGWPLLFVSRPLAGGPRLDFFQAMAGAGIEIEIVEAFQLLYAFERSCAERSFPVEGMEDDALQQIAEGHVVILGEGFQDFEQALLHAHPGLHSFDQELGIICHGTNVPQYAGTCKTFAVGQGCGWPLGSKPSRSLEPRSMRGILRLSTSSAFATLLLRSG